METKQPDFYCEKICDCEKHRNAIAEFEETNTHAGYVVQFLKSDALNENKSGDSSSYLVFFRSTNEVAAYFTFKCGSISFSKSGPWYHKLPNYTSGVELALFATNKSFKQKHSECQYLGLDIFVYMILPMATYYGNALGCKILYLFALNESLVSYYHRLGFHRISKRHEKYLNRHSKPAFDRGCIFMYQTLNRDIL